MGDSCGDSMSPPVSAAVLTISDRCSAGTAVDTAGPAAAALLRQSGAKVVWTGLVPDEAAVIAERLVDLCQKGIDLVLTVGGTGFGPRDVTPEATRGVLEREAPGLAEAMRLGSSAATRRAFLSRAVAGVRGRTLLVNLPGSERAARENLQAILDLLPHAVAMLRGEAHPHLDPPRPAPADSGEQRG